MNKQKKTKPKRQKIKREGFLNTFYYNYLKPVIHRRGLLDEEGTKEIFLKSLDDFFTGKIDLDTLRGISCHLYYELGNTVQIDSSFNIDLVNALSDASDIPSPQDSENAKVYSRQMKEIKKYYQKYKNLLLHSQNH